MKTACLLAFLLLAPIACAKDKSHPVADDDAAAVRAAAITAQYKLTTNSTDCLLFDTSDRGTKWLVRVRENHNQHHKPPCSGDPDTSPTLFMLEIRKSDGYTTTNAYSLGEPTEKLRPPES